MENKELLLKLDSLVEQVKELNAKKQYWRDFADAKIEEIEAKVKSETEKLDEAIILTEAEARAVFDMLPAKETKTQYKISTLSGDVVVKKPTQKIVQPATDDLLTMIFDAGREDLVKTVQKPMWADFKKLLTISGDKVVNTETGETLNIAIEDVPEQLVIK